jgi:hypothetical protein
MHIGPGGYDQTTIEFCKEHGEFSPTHMLLNLSASEQPAIARRRGYVTDSQ